MSLSFLGKKSFHPSNPKNLVKLFKAEENQKNEAQRKDELARQFAQEEAQRQVRSLVNSRSGGPAEPPASMSFMYALPPGLSEAQERQKAAAASSQADKRPADRDIERFPLLKDAPRQGDYTLGIEVTHKPFAVELRKVRCTRCNTWGHQAGDRECPMRNALRHNDDELKTRLDPVARLPGAEASGAQLRWELKHVPDAGIRGCGSVSSDPNQQFVVGDEQNAAPRDASALADIDPGVLAALSEKQQRKLLKMYRQELKHMVADEEQVGSKRKHHSEGKKLKKKHRKDSKKAKKSKKSLRSDASDDSSSVS